jgi:hypothetical protein
MARCYHHLATDINHSHTPQAFNTSSVDGRLLLALRTELLHERERIDRLADVDRDGRDFEVVRVLLVLALPDELRIQGRIAGVAHDRGPLLFQGSPAGSPGKPGSTDEPRLRGAETTNQVPI